MSRGRTKLARRVRQGLALLALFAASTGQVGSCASDHRDRPIQRLPDAMLPQGLRGGVSPVSRGNGVRMNVLVSPSPARIGQAIRYLAVVRADRDQKVRFDPPQSGGEFTWSELRAGREHPKWWKQSAYVAMDSVWFEARLQVFTTGVIAIPGLVVRLDPLPNSAGPGFTRLPSAHVVVLPTVTAADSNQSLRGLHGPLGAPWWERVPLALIVAGAALLATWLLVLSKLRQRKRKPVRRVAAPAMVPSRPRIDPAAEALRALFTLRAKKLPQQQLFGEHALELTAILRRFLEATVATPRPGDTSGELLERLRATRSDKDDLERLEGLLGLWDRVKFARAPLTEQEATRCEESVEAYVRRVAQARLDAEAAAARAAAARAATSDAGPNARPPAASDPKPPAGAPRSGGSPSSGALHRPSGAGPRPSGTGARPSSGSMSRPPASAAGSTPNRPSNRPPSRGAA